MDDEHKSVVVLNLLHGRLCRQGMLNDGIMIEFASTGRRLSRVFGRSTLSEGLGTMKPHGCAYLLLDGCVSALQHGFLGLESISLSFTQRGWGERETKVDWCVSGVTSEETLTLLLGRHLLYTDHVLGKERTKLRMRKMVLLIIIASLNILKLMFTNLR